MLLSFCQVFLEKQRKALIISLHGKGRIFLRNKTTTANKICQNRLKNLPSFFHDAQTLMLKGNAISGMLHYLYLIILHYIHFRNICLYFFSYVNFKSGAVKITAEHHADWKTWKIYSKTAKNSIVKFEPMGS